MHNSGQVLLIAKSLINKALSSKFVAEFIDLAYHQYSVVSVVVCFCDSCRRRIFYYSYNGPPELAWKYQAPFTLIFSPGPIRALFNLTVGHRQRLCRCRDRLLKTLPLPSSSIFLPLQEVFCVFCVLPFSNQLQRIVKSLANRPSSQPKAPTIRLVSLGCPALQAIIS